MADEEETPMYFDILTNEADVSFAYENSRYSDYTLNVQLVQPLDSDKLLAKSVSSPATGMLWVNRSLLEARSDPPSGPLPYPRCAAERIIIPVNSLLLASKSLFFRKLIDSGKYLATKELPVSIAEKDLALLYVLLRFMYVGAFKFEHSQLPDLLQLLLVADHFQVPSFIKMTVDHLKTRPMDADACHRLLALPEHLEPLTYPLLDRCADYLEERFQHLDLLKVDNKMLQEFRQLSCRALSFILRSDTVTVESEDTVFVLLQYWAKANGVVPRDFHSEPYSELLEHLRYAFMTPEYLSDKVASSPYLSSEQGHKLVTEGRIFRAAPDSFSSKLVEDADHIRFLERPKPPQHVVLEAEGFAAQSPSAAMGQLLSRMNFWSQPAPPMDLGAGPVDLIRAAWGRK